MLAVLRGDKKIVVPDGYHENFRRAYWTFKHARVYDPKLRRLRPLNPTPPELEKEGADTSFLGPLMHDAIAVDVAEGRLDPISRKPFVVPPSPPRQRGWAPRGHAREHGSPSTLAMRLLNCALWHLREGRVQPAYEFLASAASCGADAKTLAAIAVTCTRNIGSAQLEAKEEAQLLSAVRDVCARAVAEAAAA